MTEPKRKPKRQTQTIKPVLAESFRLHRIKEGFATFAEVALEFVLADFVVIGVVVHFFSVANLFELSREIRKVEVPEDLSARLRRVRAHAVAVQGARDFKIGGAVELGVNFAGHLDPRVGIGTPGLVNPSVAVQDDLVHVVQGEVARVADAIAVGDGADPMGRVGIGLNVDFKIQVDWAGVTAHFEGEVGARAFKTGPTRLDRARFHMDEVGFAAGVRKALHHPVPLRVRGLDGGSRVGPIALAGGAACAIGASRRIEGPLKSGLLVV
jgi:hypothetical protein